MPDKEKKPPVRVGKVNQGDTEEEPKPGGLSYISEHKSEGGKPSSGRPGINLTQVLLSSIIAIVVAAFLIFQLAPSKSSVSDRLTALETSMVTLSSGQNSDSLRLDNVVNTMGEYAKKSELDSLASLPTDLNAQFATLSTSLEARMTELEASLQDSSGAGSSGGSTVEETTRWSFREVKFLSPTVSDNVSIRVDSDRVEEEGLYDVDLDITNTGGVSEPLNTGIELILVPRDYVVVDEDTTFLDSDDSPWLNWDEDFITREREGEDVTRRIIFTSDTHNFGSLAPGGRISLRLVLELVYLPGG